MRQMGSACAERRLLAAEVSPHVIGLLGSQFPPLPVQMIWVPLAQVAPNRQARALSIRVAKFPA